MTLKTFCEAWAPIPGLGNKYEVSNQGRVRTLPYLARYNHWITGQELFRQTKEKIIAQQKQNCGYWIVHLWHEDKRIAKTVHRLVASAFCPGYFEEADVNHKDGVKGNNLAGNLEWVTRTNNHLHAVKLRLNLRAIPVIDPATGARYDSLQQAQKATGRNRLHIHKHFIKVDDLV